MKILNHRLHQDDGTPYPYVESPNRGGAVEHRYLVMHFTAGRSAESSVQWLTNPTARASAHVVVGRDGSITQLVPFNRIAWHAGASAWEGLTGLNAYSLGIELDNAGRLSQQGNLWRAWFGDPYEDAVVLEATHKHETDSSGWHIYTTVQLETAQELASLLYGRYELLDVIGHDDIAPGRKSDPGPAFPMQSFRSRVIGREADEPVRYETTAALNIRQGAGTEHTTLTAAPLPPGTQVEVLERRDPWWRVDVLDVVEGVMDLEGWVHSRYLRRSG